MIPPYITSVAINPKIQRDTFVFRRNHFLKSIPAIKPIIPKANICHGVQGTCPKKKFETNPVMLPTQNPVYPPKHTPAIITSATTCFLDITY